MARALESPRSKERASVSQEHEALMQEFVHSHLMTILQPFREQMSKLQENIDRVALQVPPLAEEVVQNREQISRVVIQFPPLEKADVELDQRIKQISVLVKDVAQKYQILAEDHKELKSCLTEADGRLRGAAEQIDDLIGGQNGVMSKIDRVSEGLTDVQKHVTTVVESRLNYLHTFCKDLRKEQTSQLESMSHFDSNFARNAEATKQVRVMLSAKQVEDDEKFACLNQYAKGIEAKLSHLPDPRSNDDTIKQQEKEIQRVSNEVQQLRSMQQLFAEYSEIFISVKENTRRVSKVEDTVQMLSARNPVEVIHFQETVQRLQSQVDDNETRLQAVDRNQIGISGRIEQVARLIEPFEPEIKGLERRCSVTDAEVQSLALWQHGATEKFEAQAAKLLQQKSEHQKLLAEVDARGVHVEQLKEELAQAQRRLIRIDGHVDVMQKYFTGFGKGLQDTTRSISVGDGLTPRATPPRPQSATAPATGLPTLCGAISPRRRPWSSKEVRSRDFE